MKQKLARRCPELGGYCYLTQCLSQDRCTSAPKTGDSGVTKAYEIPDSWDCPSDGQPCQLLSCDRGKACYAAGKSTGITYGSGGIVYKSAAASPPCHEGMNSIGFIGKAEIMCGTETSAKGWDAEVDGPIGLVIGLLGEPYRPGNLIGMNDGAKALGSAGLNILWPTVPNIWLKWPDFGIVPCTYAWWSNLVGLISKVDGAVLLYCWGGHGRTGTAAAIIASIAGLVPDGDDPVEWIRKVYCEKAVESVSQLDYIEKITGRKVLAGPAKAYSYKGSTSGGHTNLTHYSGSKKKSPGLKGGSGGPRKTRADPNQLSKRQWKRWWRKVPVSQYPELAQVTRVQQLPDGAVFAIGTKVWQWNKTADKFVLVTDKPTKG